MTDNHLPNSIINPELLDYLGASAEVDTTKRFPVKIRPERHSLIDDRDLFNTAAPSYKYANKIVLSDDSVYMLNRLFTYYQDNCGVSHVNDWHHVYAMINTYPILRELWDQFEEAMALCGSHELRGRKVI